MAEDVEPTSIKPLPTIGAPSLGLVAAAGCAATLAVAACGALTAGRELGDGPLPCPFRAVTGLPCPFCGMTHSLLALGGGDLRESVHRNPLGPALLVLAVVALWRLGRAARARAPSPGLPRGAVAVGLAALSAEWTVQLAGGLA